MRRRPFTLVVAVGLTAAAVMLALSDSTLAYLKLGSRSQSGGTVTLRWRQFPVRYYVTDLGVAWRLRG